MQPGSDHFHTEKSNVTSNFSRHKGDYHGLKKMQEWTMAEWMKILNNESQEYMRHKDNSTFFVAG